MSWIARKRRGRWYERDVCRALAERVVAKVEGEFESLYGITNFHRVAEHFFGTGDWPESKARELWIDDWVQSTSQRVRDLEHLTRNLKDPSPSKWTPPPKKKTAKRTGTA